MSPSRRVTETKCGAGSRPGRLSSPRSWSCCEHDRLRERVESSERENERLRGVTYENEQLRNRLETSERQAEQLRQSMGELRADNDRHQKEREEAAERLNHLVNEIAQRLRPSAGVSRT